MKWILLAIALLIVSSDVSANNEDGTSLVLTFQHDVDMRIELPQEAQVQYAELLEDTLNKASTSIEVSQYVMLVDRNPNVQVIFLYWLDALSSSDRWRFIGASPVSTGRPGRFDHFITPLGIFAHTLKNKVEQKVQRINSAFAAMGEKECVYSTLAGLKERADGEATV